MRKKLVALLMSAAMAVGMLSGCGSSSKSSNTGSVVSGDDAGGQTTMSDNTECMDIH